jgi:hypothetical protein
MTNELFSIIDDLEEFFTTDAWSLLETFFSNLRAKMIETGIPTAEQKTVVEGLDYYISEFVENYKNKEKVNYESTLKLLREIGSPTDIILEVSSEKIRIKTSETEIKVEGKTPRFCPRCQYPNASDAIFCENCGKKFVTMAQLKDRIIQESIDHIYIASFLVIYPILGGLGFILNTSVPNLVQRLAMSFGMLIVPTLVLTLIVGTVLNSFTKDMKSFKVKYNQILNHFEETVLGGFVSAFMASIIFGLLALMGIIWSFPVAIIVLTTSFIWLVVVVVQSKKPQGIPYLTLLTAKRMFDSYVQEKLLKFNLFGGIVIVTFIVIWNFSSYNSFFTPPLTFEGAIRSSS